MRFAKKNIVIVFSLLLVFVPTTAMTSSSSSSEDDEQAPVDEVLISSRSDDKQARPPVDEVLISSSDDKQAPVDDDEVLISSSDDKQEAPPVLDEVSISSECAAVLIGTATAIGAGAAYALTPAAMCLAGFSSMGVTQGSFAALWQSTMPLVQTGSVFAQLQALAMGGAGLGKITLAAGTVGGLTGAAFLQDFCAIVDETDPESKLGKAIAASAMAGRALASSQEYIATQCASSETCRMVSNAAASAGKAVSKTTAQAAAQATELLKSKCETSDICQAAGEVGAAISKFASVFAKSFTKGSAAPEDEATEL